MFIRTCAAVLILGLAVMGCEKAPEASKAADAAKDAAAKATDAAKDAASSAKDAAASATDAAKDAANKLVAESETKLTEINKYISENKLDLAEKALAELEKIKDKLPEAIQSKLTSARSMLDAAKAKKPA